MQILFALHAGENCGNVILKQHRPQVNYWNSVDDADRELLTLSPWMRTNADTVLIIPVVVHVLHTGEPLNTGSNISDTRILAALQKANQEWNDSSDRGAYMAVKFCLAQVDPNGNPTSGIVRIDASGVANYESLGIGYAGNPGADETTLKQLSNWPHNKYYNIWVVNKIGGGWAGFAYYPTANNFTVDGTIIAANSVKAGNETLAHELGHALGLYHTFEGGDDVCPPNDNCAAQGDRICDTPPHKKVDCILSPCTSSPELFLSTQNIMSYCNAIRILYTEGQKVRSRNAIRTTTRAALLISDVCGCSSVFTNLNGTTCSPDSATTFADTLSTLRGCDSIVNTTYTYVAVPGAAFNHAFVSAFQVNFDMLSSIGAGTSVLWNFGDGNISTQNDPSHTYAGAGSYRVVLYLSNTCGTDSAVVNIVITPTGIANNKVPDSKIYPNPASGVFTLELPVKENTKLYVINVLGQKTGEYVLTAGKTHLINLKNNLPEGLYHLQIQDNHGLWSAGKIVVE